MGRLLSELPPGEPDPSTLARLADGDITGLAEVFKLYGQRVYRLARRMMGNQADAEDATQEIFLRAFEHAHTFQGRSGLYTWLYRLAVWYCINKIKQRERRNSHEHSAQAELQLAHLATVSSPLDRLGERERAELAEAIVQSLPPHYRVCLVLREVEGFKYAQIADLLEIPVGTVMSRLARAREMLRAQIRGPRAPRPAFRNNSDASVVQSLQEQASDDLC